MLAAAVLALLGMQVQGGGAGSASARIAVPAGGGVFSASDAAGFTEALKKAGAGDTIKLAAGTYPVLTVEKKDGVTVSGPRDAKLDGVAIVQSTGITLEGVSVTPSADVRAEISLERSSGVVVKDVLVDGRDEHVGAGIVADETVSGLTVDGSEITNCGENNRCLAFAGTTGVVVSGNAFHDCLSCDFIRGGSGMTIRGNSFDRAVHGSCEQEGTPCPHNDHIQILGGGPWKIIANTFGDRAGGAATIYISPGKANASNPIHDVSIVSNLFRGEAGRYAIEVVGGQPVKSGLIRNVSIVNNTILSGRLAALAIGPGWDAVSASARPLVANNIFGIIKTNVCPRAVFVANVVDRGHTSCDGLRKATLGLDASGAPTKASTAIVNKADARYAPKTDLYGHLRNGRPDIGAIEYRGKSKGKSL